MAIGAGLVPGTKAVVPAITFVATAAVARLTGADVVFSDVDPDTGLMSAEHFAAATDGERDVKAVFPVHLNGALIEMGEMTAISSLAHGMGAVVLEDACHAIGAVSAPDDGTVIQRGGDSRQSMASALSFHAVKAVTTAEGGAITTNCSTLAARYRRLRNHGIDRPAPGTDEQRERPWFYSVEEPAYNYRISDLQCALGVSQLDKLDAFLSRRRELARIYDDAFAQSNMPVRPVPVPVGCSSARHLYPVLIDFKALGIARGDVMNQLFAKGIGTQVHYIPVPCHPAFGGNESLDGLPGARAYYDRVLSLPLHPGLQDEDVQTVVAAVRDCIGRG